MLASMPCNSIRLQFDLPWKISQGNEDGLPMQKGKRKNSYTQFHLILTRHPDLDCAPRNTFPFGLNLVTTGVTPLTFLEHSETQHMFVACCFARARNCSVKRRRNRLCCDVCAAVANSVTVKTAICRFMLTIDMKNRLHAIVYETEEVQQAPLAEIKIREYHAHVKIRPGLSFARLSSQSVSPRE